MAAQQFDAVLAHADSGVVPFNYNDRIGNRLVETEEQLIAGELNFLYIEVRSWLCTLFKIQEPFTPDPIPSWHNATVKWYRKRFFAQTKNIDSVKTAISLWGKTSAHDQIDRCLRTAIRTHFVKEGAPAPHIVDQKKDHRFRFSLQAGAHLLGVNDHQHRPFTGLEFAEFQRLKSSHLIVEEEYPVTPPLAEAGDDRAYKRIRKQKDVAPEHQLPWLNIAFGNAYKTAIQNKEVALIAQEDAEYWEENAKKLGRKLAARDVELQKLKLQAAAAAAAARSLAPQAAAAAASSSRPHIAVDLTAESATESAPAARPAAAASAASRPAALVSPRSPPPPPGPAAPNSPQPIFAPSPLSSPPSFPAHCAQYVRAGQLAADSRALYNNQFGSQQQQLEVSHVGTTNSRVSAGVRFSDWARDLLTARRILNSGGTLQAVRENNIHPLV